MTTIGTEFPEVLAAAQEGAEWAWAIIYESVAPQLVGYARAKGAPEPEDVVGEVLHDVARNLAAFSGSEANFRSWVFGIAHNRLIDQWRRQRRRRREPAIRSRLHPSAEQTALAGWVDGPAFAALEDLTDSQRTVMLLRTMGDLSLEDVAEILGTSVNAVKATQHRAVVQLRKKLGEAVTKSSGPTVTGAR